MRILVLGRDGYLVWPTALHLSAPGHEVAATAAELSPAE
jgi:UDP-sulfoquinovose synthase